MEYIDIHSSKNWQNHFKNFRAPINTHCRIRNVPEPCSAMQALQRATAGLQTLIGRAEKALTTLRAAGSGWSISPIAVTPGFLLETQEMNFIASMPAHHVSLAYSKNCDALLIAQGGALIADINAFLEQHGRSLGTSGANNGQTIAGAISTGTHGSALESGGIQDHVVGLHLVTHKHKHVWLERASHPVVSQRFVQELGTQLVQDDALFNAALVSFGSFGVIHAVLLETEPIYLLEMHRIRVPFNKTLLHAIDTLDLSVLLLPYPRERPYHFDVVINPYNTEEGAFVTVMYKRPFIPELRTPKGPPGRREQGGKAMHVIGTATSAIPYIIPNLVNTAVDSLYKEYGNRFGTLDDMFGPSSLSAHVSGTAIGVSIENASKALTLILKAITNHTPQFAGVIGIRFVQPSPALMAFTTFNPTCVIDLDGVDNRGNRAFFKRIWKRLDESTIPFTLHWGKANDNKTADRLRAINPDTVNQWLQLRRQFLCENTFVFTNPFLVENGLR